MPHLALATVLIFVATATAQGPTTFPPGFDTTTQPHYSDYLGRYSAMRYQALYGGLQGSNRVEAFTSLALRRESHTGFTNYGRSWSSVVLNVGDSDYTKLSDTFHDNLAVRTEVFSGSLTWPDTTGLPPSTPGAWGEFAAKDDMTFPFGAGGANSSFMHHGKLGFCVEFEMSGGTLTNGSDWLSGVPYYHDGIAQNNQFTGGDYRYSLAGPNCLETGFATWLFTDKRVDGSLQHRAQMFAELARPNQMHIGVIGVEAHFATAVPFGQSCNPLWVDVSKPVVNFVFFTSSSGHYASPFITSTFVPASIGLHIDTQAGYRDPSLGLQLTRAARARVTAPPSGSPTFYGSRLYVHGGTRPLGKLVGFGPYATRVPIVYCK